MPAEEGCEIAASMGQLIHNGTLQVSQASAITSAIAASIAASDINKTNQDEQQVIAAQMISQLMLGFTSGTTDPILVAKNTAISNAVVAVAKSVAAASYKAYAIKTSSKDEDRTGYANQVAGSAAQAVALALPGGDGTSQANDRMKILLKIATAVEGVTPTQLGDFAVGTAVSNVLGDPSGNLYAVNCLTEQETPVTNY